MEKGTIKIAFAAPKGGVGKSCFTTLISTSLHYLTDKKVITLDCDFPQFSINTMRKRDLEQIKESDYFKQLAYNQFTESGKKAYPILCAKPEYAISTLQEYLEKSGENFDIALFDLAGTANSTGVLNTIAQMDYIIIPIIADYVVIDSCLKFANIVNDNILKNENTNLKGVFLFWNMVNNAEKTSLYDTYENVIKELGLTILKTRIPDLIRFKKEILTDRKTVFRSTIFPVTPKRLLTDSNIEPLIAEIREIINL